MNWLFWKLYRKQLIFTGLIVLAYAITLIILGIVTAHGYAYAQSHKVTEHGVTFANFEPSGAARYMPLATIAFPVLIGMFWGAPLFAREYEEGTHMLAWAQATTRHKWLAIKLVWLLLAAGICGVIFSLAAGWCLRTEHMMALDRFEWVHFDVGGFMPIVYAIFAVALGAMIGAWTRRVLLTVAMTLGALVVLQGTMGLYVRAHYATPITTQATSRYAAPKQGGEGMPLDTPVTTGQVVPENSAVWQLGVSFAGGNSGIIPCPANLTDRSNLICTSTTMTTTYQPADRYWRFQLIETGIYVLLTLVCIITTYRLVLKRDA